MSLIVDCCWVFLWWVLPSSCLSEGHSVHCVLYSIVQVQTGCVEAGSSVCLWLWGFSLTIFLLFVVDNFSTVSCNSRSVPVGGYCGFHSCLCHLPLLSVGGSFVGGFSLPAGILVFTAPTYSFMWSFGGGRQNGLRQQECILGDLKYQHVEKR